tara:strand:+ start:938 stop:1696 length:759 start_codon:yes stop_codon:yes gene_type:complete
MSLTIKTDGDFEKLGVGLYSGTCYRIIDMGTTEQEYEGVTSKKKRVHITFEVTASLDSDGNPQAEDAGNPTKMNDGKPFVVSKIYTASLFESAALRKDLVSWRGKNFSDEELAGFNIDKLLGCTANVEVGLTKGGNPKIIGVFKPDGGVQVVPTVNDTAGFDLDVYAQEWTGNMSDASKKMCDIFESLPMWMQTDIDDSFELQAAKRKGETVNSTPVTSNLADLATEAEAQNSPNFDEDNNKETLTEDKIPF